MPTPSSESHALRGEIDRDALIEFRDVVEDIEPMASADLDDYLTPGELNIVIDDGIGDSPGGRFNIRWTTRNDYNIHYSGKNGAGFRWDIHPHDYPIPDDDRHFHPPPDASNDVDESCIEVTKVEIVARGMISCWRNAYEAGSWEIVNGLINPP